jgi:signal transduction histidine kinase
VVRTFRRLPAGAARAAKVALAASLLVGVVYAGCVAVLDLAVSARLVASVQERLSERLSDVAEEGLRASYADDDDLDATPVYLWRQTPAGPVAAEPGRSTPALPATLRLTAGRAATVRLHSGPLRVLARAENGQVLLAGQSLQGEEHVTVLLRQGEALAAPVLLLAMFSGAFVIGLRALAPAEQSRRRQLEFTADASHELRTPLSVISAETSLALSAPRTATEYQATLGRVESETARLRRIVEDLLWLARFDSAPPQPGAELVDLAAIARTCAARFGVLAAGQDIRVDVRESAGRALVYAPADWIDRLTGALTDNACRYAGSGGVVRLTAGRAGNRVTLTVEDSGPGIPPAGQDRLFDRFHRSTEQGGSAGLGLAIADSIVTSSDGQWRLGRSDLGGALFEVSWRRASTRQAARPAVAVAPPPAAAAGPDGVSAPGEAGL